MEVVRHWRLKKQRLALVGEQCPSCEEKIFPPRDICPECGHIVHGLSQLPSEIVVFQSKEIPVTTT